MPAWSATGSSRSWWRSDRDHRFDVHLVGAEEYEPYNRILLTEVLAKRSDVAALTLPRPPERGLGAARGDRDLDRPRGAAGRARRRHRARATTTWCSPPAPARSCRRSTGSTARTRPGTCTCCARSTTAATWSRAPSTPGTPSSSAAGVLGLEAACGLARRGLAVTVVHLDGHLMAEQLDPGPAAGARPQTLDDLGVRVHTSTSVGGGHRRRTASWSPSASPTAR